MLEMIAHMLLAGILVFLYASFNFMCIEWLFKGIVVMLGESVTKHGWFGRTLGGLVAFGAAHILVLQFHIWTA